MNNLQFRHVRYDGWDYLSVLQQIYQLEKHHVKRFMVTMVTAGSSAEPKAVQWSLS